MRGFLAFFGALLDEAKGAEATFRLGAYYLLACLICNHNVMGEGIVPFAWKVWRLKVIFRKTPALKMVSSSVVN